MIRVLDKWLADKIAAGEVIDRPVSIVKELVENALDAEASSVTVELRRGGKEYLRVTDDGCGIPAEETELAFRRHATSKIASEEDLNAIRSLGFRGEALASICAVSRVEMITKTSDAKAGRRLVCEGGEILQNAATGCPEGTTITVRDLFYNLPARRKFLGSDGAEARRIIDVMSRIALAYPDVRFRLISGRQEVFQTTGKGSILDNISRIYGRDMAKDLVPVDAARDGYLLRGFVSSPGASTSSRSRQFFCVNGRIVSSHVMERGLEKAYRERLFAGRFPIAFLFLQLPPEQVDVNVHPTKKEIRFHDAFGAEDFIAEAVTAALQRKEAIPRADSRMIRGMEKQEREANLSEGKPERKASDPGQQIDIKNLLKSMREETEQTVLREAELSYAVREENGAPTANNAEGGAPEHVADAPAHIRDTSDASAERLPIEELQVIGTVFQTYIIASEGDTMYLIDQHAAHERVFYERLLKQYHSAEKYSQEMLVPLQVSVSAEVEHAEESWIGYLRQMGYDIENFGGRMYIVRTVPASTDPGDAERFLRDLLLGLEQGPDIHSFASMDKLIMRSCKSAVKGGDVLSMEEIHALLKQLAACGNPWSCPHGRPTIIRMRRSELERMFKR